MDYMIVKKEDNLLQEQKSQLAKLMANENLTIEHQKISTAKFDPKNRILYLPIWTDMIGTTYDLLCGHEVGHALYTPAEGWHDAVTINNKGKNYKNFLNVIEDARIEKRVQRKYPGLKKSFKTAYADLREKDFFGLKGRDANKLAFIDRLNLFTKSQYTMALDFNEEETKLLERVKTTESWSEVVDVTNDVYAYSTEEQLDYEDEMMSQQEQFFSEDPDEEEGDYDEYESNDSKDDDSKDGDNDGNNSDSDSDEEDKDESENENQTNVDDEDSDEEDGDEDGQVAGINRFKDSGYEESEIDNGPRCETDENYRNNENSLVDEESKEFIYLDFPKPIMKNIITPAKKVQELLAKDFQDQELQGYFKKGFKDEIYNDFKKKNDKFVALLAKEFEMKKAARVYGKRKIASTGDIDINKLASYKFNDDIFKKMTSIPEGKSHGLILLLDYSGSMWDNIQGAIEQVLILSSFCRKVNIPFTVQTFSDTTTTWYMDRDIEFDSKTYKEDKDIQSFEAKPGHLKLENVVLREYLNSNMNKAEYTKAVQSMLLLAKSYDHNLRYDSVNRPYTPKSERLTNTPLTQALVALGQYTNEFKASRGLDIVNLVIVHDGDADYCHDYVAFGLNEHQKYPDDHMLKGKYMPKEEHFPHVHTKRMDPQETNIVLKDDSIRFTSRIKSNYSQHDVFLNTMSWFKKLTGSKIIGFYVVASNSREVKDAVYRQYVNEDGQTVNDKGYEKWEYQKNIVKIFRKEKLLVSQKPNYDDFYLILGGKDLNAADLEVEVTGKVTANKLKNAFMKVNKSKVVNRVLVSKFIDKIAA